MNGEDRGRRGFKSIFATWCYYAVAFGKMPYHGRIKMSIRKRTFCCLVVVLISFSLAVSANAVQVGFEDFSYNDGPINDKAGGVGFDYDNTTENGPFIGHTGTTSDWDNVEGAPQVVSGALVTNDHNSAYRQYNGPTEGVYGSDERWGAVNQRPDRDAHIIFFAFDMTRAAGNSSWGGASSYDFAGEKLFFGVPNAVGADDRIGIQWSGVDVTPGDIYLTDGQTYRLVAVLDFDNDLLGLFVDPDGSDYWNPATAENSADVTHEYTSGSWSTAVRLGSGQPVTWDNVTVATEPRDVGIAVPEPDSLALICCAAMLFLAGLGRRLRFR